MVYNTRNYWIFGLSPSSGVLETENSVSETVGRDTYCPLERSNLNHSELSKGPSRVDVSPQLRLETDPVSET
jgi:hypothetical protein